MMIRKCKHTPFSYYQYFTNLFSTYNDDFLCSRNFYDKRMGQEIEGDVLGDEYKGYIFKITGGNDK